MIRLLGTALAAFSLMTNAYAFESVCACEGCAETCQAGHPENCTCDCGCATGQGCSNGTK